MGNQLASAKPVQSPTGYFLHELPHNVGHKETLGGGRCMKTLRCFHDEGQVVVKVYFKRGEALDVQVLFFLFFHLCFALNLALCFIRGTKNNLKCSEKFSRAYQIRIYVLFK